MTVNDLFMQDTLVIANIHLLTHMHIYKKNTAQMYCITGCKNLTDSTDCTLFDKII